MKKRTFTLFITAILGMAVTAHGQLFPESIKIPTGYVLKEVLLPPSPLTMQVLFVGGHDVVETTRTYGNPAGRAIAKEWHDFIGITRDSSNASQGWVTVNHEMIYRDDKIGDGGGMTMFKIKRTSDGKLEVVDQKLKDGREGKFFNIDFVNTVGETGMNCGGIQAPNGRIWTAEEWFRSNTASIHTGNVATSTLPLRVGTVTNGHGVRDTANWRVKSDIPGWDTLNLKKFENFNWMVEVDPKEAKVFHNKNGSG
jgi:secreted PhoX family phosphatase